MAMRTRPESSANAIEALDPRGDRTRHGLVVLAASYSAGAMVTVWTLPVSGAILSGGWPEVLSMSTV